MKRLVVSVEGPTERAFVQQILSPHLTALGWSVCKAVLLGDRGGNVSLPRIRKDVRLLARNFDCVTTLYDLYGFQGRGPRSALAMEQAMTEAVGDVPSFIPYVQKFEFEAFLFSDVAAIYRTLGGAANVFSQLKQASSSALSPEEINDGFDTCPSRRLLKAYPRYDKVLQGPALAAEIGLAQMRQECPRFANWVSQLEQHRLLEGSN